VEVHPLTNHQCIIFGGQVLFAHNDVVVHRGIKIISIETSLVASSIVDFFLVLEKEKFEIHKMPSLSSFL